MAGRELDAIDREIVNALQAGLPVCERPFAPLGDRLGVSEQAIVDRLGALLSAGVLSRFGPMFDAERMGGAFHLCAMAVPAALFDVVAAQVNAWPEVAHNYARDHELNMWFVLGSDDAQSIQRCMEGIEAQTGLHVYDMPKLDEYYVRLRLDAGAPPLPTRRDEEDARCA